MRQKNQPNAWRYLILLIAAFGITSCASTGMERSQDVKTSLRDMDGNIKAATRQLEATGTALDNLMRSGQTDVQKAFDTYKDNVSKMENLEENFASHADEMTARGTDYFEEWQKEGTEYTNPRIQQLSNQRRTEVEKVYDQIAENSVGVSEAFKTYVSDVKEIQSYLSNDLTPKGIAAIAPTSEKVVSDGDSLKNALQDMQSAIQRARAEMSHSGSNQ